VYNPVSGKKNGATSDVKRKEYVILLGIVLLFNRCCRKSCIFGVDLVRKFSTQSG